MNRWCALAMSCLLAGCALRPPLPPDCEGELTPINAAPISAPQGNVDATRTGG